jgi:hypothetical protein
MVSYNTTVPTILFRVGITRVAVFMATFLLVQAFLGLFHSLLKFEEMVHKLRKGIGLFFFL